MCSVSGYVARCLENFLCDQSFWLDPELLSDLQINVTVDEEHLATLYLGLVLQEGQLTSYLLLLRNFPPHAGINKVFPILSLWKLGSGSSPFINSLMINSEVQKVKKRLCTIYFTIPP